MSAQLFSAGFVVVVVIELGTVLNHHPFPHKTNEKHILIVLLDRTEKFYAHIKENQHKGRCEGAHFKQLQEDWHLDF